MLPNCFVVVYDASVLYPQLLRDILMRIGLEELVQPKWTDEIMREWTEALERNRPDLAKAGKVQKVRAAMEAAAPPDWKITGYEPLISALDDLPHPQDGHVIAAAIRSQAQLIVTSNLRHFPENVLQPLGIEAIAPDRFLASQIDLAPVQMARIIQQIADTRIEPTSFNDIRIELHGKGFRATALQLDQTLT